MNKNNKKAFTIIEILVWIFIFSLWAVSVLSIMINTINLNDYNKNYIIAANLAREQIELFRNIRDSNYVKIQAWNQINPSLAYDPDLLFQTWAYYKIANDFSSWATFPVKVEEITDFWEWLEMLNTKMQDYRLYLDWNNLYTYDAGTWNEETEFYKYIRVDEVQYNDWWTTIIIEWALKITSKVIWIKKWYKEFEVTTIFTDFKRY